MDKKKPPPPLPKPAKPPAPPSKDPVEMSLDDISIKPTTVVGVPAIVVPKDEPKEAKQLKTVPLSAVAAPKVEPLPVTPLGTPQKEEEAPRAPAKPAEKKAEIKTVMGMPAAKPEEPERPPARKVASEPPKPTQEEDEEIPSPLGGGGGLPKPIRDLLETLRKQGRALLDGPRPRLIAFAAVGGLLVLVSFGLIVKLLSKPSEEVTTTAASASASTEPNIVATAPPPTATAPPKPVSCVLSGGSHVIAPRAIVAPGLEIVPLAGAYSVGFATGAREASIVAVDASGKATGDPHKLPGGAADVVKRVTPITTDTGAMDVDTKGDALRGRRIVGAHDVGAKGDELVWAPHGTSDAKTLWKLASGDPVDAIRGVATADGIAVTYRQSGSIWAGVAKGANLENGSPPVHVAGLGPTVGSPAIAVSGNTTLVVWADRASKEDPWSLRYFTWRPGALPSGQAFASGPGETAIAPSLAPLRDGHFLLVWTEGATSSQQVRAQVLGSDGAPAGSALTISSPGTHAGQGRAAFTADGHGVIVFLSAVGNPFEVRASAITCD